MLFFQFNEYFVCSSFVRAGQCFQCPSPVVVGQPSPVVVDQNTEYELELEEVLIESFDEDELVDEDNTIEQIMEDYAELHNSGCEDFLLFPVTCDNF